MILKLLWKTFGWIRSMFKGLKVLGLNFNCNFSYLIQITKLILLPNSRSKRLIIVMQSNTNGSFKIYSITGNYTHVLFVINQPSKPSLNISEQQYIRTDHYYICYFSLFVTPFHPSFSKDFVILINRNFHWIIAFSQVWNTGVIICLCVTSHYY